MRRSFVIALALLACAVSATAAPGFALHTEAQNGRMVIANPEGERVRLMSVNWFGFESGAFVAGGLNHQLLSHIVGLIKAGGFNSVRLPWSNDMLRASSVAPEFLKSNPNLVGKTPLQLFDLVVTELTNSGLLVILDNHRTRGDWCCDEDHGDGLWYSQAQNEAQWLEDWASMARRYVNNERVVAAELRNEIRPDNSLKLKPTWGDGVAATDWKLAAEKAAEVISAANPRLLIIIGGISYQTDLSALLKTPPHVQARNKLVYAAHDYTWNRSAAELQDEAEFTRRSFERFAALSVAGHDYSAPVYISEWGSCLQPDGQNNKPCPADRIAYAKAFAKYAATTQIDFAYWPLNGDQMPGYNRRAGTVETYGLLRPDWSGYAAPDYVKALTDR